MTAIRHLTFPERALRDLQGDEHALTGFEIPADPERVAELLIEAEQHAAYVDVLDVLWQLVQHQHPDAALVLWRRALEHRPAARAAGSDGGAR